MRAARSLQKVRSRRSSFHDQVSTKPDRTKKNETATGRDLVAWTSELPGANASTE
jgi:hypothetical protein